MPSFADSIFLFVLALLLFGPKRLPVLARELGKWVGEFRRASNEFKMQMEDELRAHEQADRQKQIAAMEAAAPVRPAIESAGEPEPEHPHMRHTVVFAENSIKPPADLETTSETTPQTIPETTFQTTPETTFAPGERRTEAADDVRPIPIAVSGDLRMMPPSTGLPSPRPRNLNAQENGNGNGSGNALGGLLDALPETTPETAHHGD